MRGDDVLTDLLAIPTDLHFSFASRSIRERIRLSLRQYKEEIGPSHGLRPIRQ
jgi:hypothetical protein